MWEKDSYIRNKMYFSLLMENKRVGQEWEYCVKAQKGEIDDILLWEELHCKYQSKADWMESSNKNTKYLP